MLLRSIALLAALFTIGCASTPPPPEKVLRVRDTTLIVYLEQDGQTIAPDQDAIYHLKPEPFTIVNQPTHPQFSMSLGVSPTRHAPSLAKLKSLIDAQHQFAAISGGGGAWDDIALPIIDDLELTAVDQQSLMALLETDNPKDADLVYFLEAADKQFTQMPYMFTSPNFSVMHDRQTREDTRRKIIQGFDSIGQFPATPIDLALEYTVFFNERSALYPSDMAIITLQFDLPRDSE